jgi:hypothetical protein
MAAPDLGGSLSFDGNTCFFMKIRKGLPEGIAGY